ncbi:MAG: prephenate dehydratase [Armatimonadetes bacterium]|nr:prephenate dehydratase [Armatimonadota bacterium]
MKQGRAHSCASLHKCRGGAPLVDSLRELIDDIDREIVTLLNERARLAQEIGKHKASGNASVFVPEREHQVMRKVLAASEGPLSGEALAAIYREIISASRALERVLRIVFWGPLYTFSHEASLSQFGASSEHVPVPTIEDIFFEVEHGRADFGIVPVENSTAGTIGPTLDMFVQSPLKVCAELYLNISHYLVSKSEGLQGIKKVYSGQQPAAQCRNWLAQHLPGIELVEVSTTARAAELSLSGPEAAAITGGLAARYYNLNILAEHIEDNPRNKTRFFVIGNKECESTGQDKTSLLFSVAHRPGSLFRAMAAFELYNVNLTLIESRPTKQMPWEYVFFVDFQGHQRDDAIAKALASLSKDCLFVRVLGSYPEAG